MTMADEVLALCAAFGCMGTLFLFATKAVVSSELRKLNGMYLRLDVFEAKMREIELHFDWLRDNMK